jgi:3-oxoacyl-[acyl-carrier protein] reductase/meso-butanediol dehydrogenase/(S,S)-butanediol dehydrogenase/diacetyl reductase
LEITGLTDKVAVVSGAGRMRSIGHSIALELARSGCNIVLTGTGRPVEKYTAEERDFGWADVESVADEVRELGRRALVAKCDVGEEEQVDNLFEAVGSTFGRVDFVVNNAAAPPRPANFPIAEMSADMFDFVIKVNLRGTFLMSRAFVRKSLELGVGSGAIVNISSESAKRLPARLGAYGASKLGVHALTHVMCHELGAEHIRVNAVCPGFIDTARTRREVPAPDAVPAPDRLKGVGRIDLAKREEYIAETIPLGRIGTGEDIAYAVTFLCSDQGSWISGQTLSVDGGQNGR